MVGCFSLTLLGCWAIWQLGKLLSYFDAGLLCCYIVGYLGVVIWLLVCWAILMVGYLTAILLCYSVDGLFGSCYLAAGLQGTWAI